MRSASSASVGLPRTASSTTTTVSAPSTGTAVVSVPVGMSLAEADRQLIFATLEQCAGVKKHAAEILGISLKTLYNRLEDYAAKGELPEWLRASRGCDASPPAAS